MNNAEQTPMQSVENKNSIKNAAKKAAAIGLLATGAVLAVPGTSQAEEVNPTPAATAEASPAAESTPTTESTPEATAEPTPAASEEPTPEPTNPDTDGMDDVLGTPPPYTTEDGGSGSEVSPTPTPIVVDDNNMVIPVPTFENDQPASLPKTGFPTGEAALAAAAAIGAGAVMVKAGERKPTDIQLPSVGPEAPVQ